MTFLATIVEGHGEVEAFPALLHRIALAIPAQQMLRVNAPIRVKSGSFLNDEDYFFRQVTLAAAKAAQEEGSVLILLDCDDDCPAELGPRLLQKVQGVRNDVEYFIALAHREYESWFLAAARSLRGIRGLPLDLEPPADIDNIRNAKGWLGQRMAQAYDPVTHQLEFSRKIDIEQARTSRSFDRIFRFVQNELTEG